MGANPICASRGVYNQYVIDIKNLNPQILWYVVGLIATDGNLSSDGRHIIITSKDIEHLITVRNALGLTSKITMKAGEFSVDKNCGDLQFSNVRFYRYLLSLGLMPRKSLILGELRVPKAYFVDFLRGVIDGDGNIRRWIHPSNKREQWELRVYSGSEQFIAWLRTTIEKAFKVTGVIITNQSLDKNPLYVLKFGKMAAREILSKIYYENALALERKSVLAKACVNSYLGWTRSFTVQVS